MHNSYRLFSAALVMAGSFAFSNLQAQADVPVQSICKANPTLCQPVSGKRNVDIKPAPPTKAELTTNPGKPTPPPRR